MTTEKFDQHLKQVGKLEEDLYHLTSDASMPQSAERSLKAAAAAMHQGTQGQAST